MAIDAGAATYAAWQQALVAGRTGATDRRVPFNRAAGSTYALPKSEQSLDRHGQIDDTTITQRLANARDGPQPSHASLHVVVEAGRVHIALQQTDLHWRLSMTDFGPALALYVLTAAVSITLALAWVV
jgi:hypothetical protein